MTTTSFTLTARDETHAAFASVNASLSRMTGAGVNLQNSFKGAALALTGLAGVGSLAALKSQIDDAIGSMAGLADAAERTGASVENLSALKSVAKIGGHDFAAAEAAIVKLNKALHGTDDESKGAGKALANVGLSVKTLRDQDPAKALLDVAHAFDEFADGGGKSAAAVAIFGKSGAQLLPLLKDLAEQQALVGKVTAEQARAADDYEKNVQRLQVSWNSLTRQLAASAAGPLKDITDWMIVGQKEGGALMSVFAGIGVAMAKAFGVEINPTQRAENQVNDLFKELQQKKRILEQQRSAGWGVGDWLADRTERDIKKIEGNLKTAIAARNRLLQKAAADTAPKDTSLDRMNFDKDGTDKVGGAAKKADPAADLIVSLDKKLAVMALDLQATGELTSAEKELAEVRAGLDSGTLKATARQKELIVGKLEALAAYEKVGRAMEVEAAAADRAQQQLAAHFDSLDDQARSLEKQADLYNLTAAQIAVVTQSRLEDALAQAREEGAGEDQIAVLERELEVRKRITAAQIAMAEKQQQIDDQARKTNETLEEFGKQAARNIQDAMADFLFDPFKNGTEGMLQSFGTMIQKMISQAVAADLAKKLFGDKIQGGEGSGLLGKGLDWITGLFANADGGVYPGARGLSAYSGTIVSQPTVFPFARGIGLMGESGPEAILPLKRGGDGKLGVAAAGGGGHTINVYVSGTHAPDVRRAAGQGAREALMALNGAQRYG